jgi:hypothetical protein
VARVMLDIGHGDALAGLLGEVEDVAGIQLEVLDSRTAVDCRPPIAEDHNCADGNGYSNTSG